MSSKVLVKILVLAVSVLIGATFVIADSLDPHGKPDPLKGSGYRVWKAEGDWHILMSSGENKRVFKGYIRCLGNGRITGAWSVKADKRGDHGNWNEREVRFSMTVKEDKDGVDFSADCRKLEFDLLMDDERKPNRVFVGSGGAHPYEMPFRIDNQ